MKIRTATQADLDSLMSITQRCIEHLDTQGIDQWDETYPINHHFHDDINIGTLYVIDMSDRILGCICINQIEYSGYEKARWLGSSFFVIHKMIIDPFYENQGFGKLAMKFAEEISRTEGKDSIRLDCYTKNIRANAFYQSLGYTVRGEAIFRNRLFHLYEKMI